VEIDHNRVDRQLICMENPCVVREHAHRHIGIVLGLKLYVGDEILVTDYSCKEVRTIARLTEETRRSVRDLVFRRI